MIFFSCFKCIKTYPIEYQDLDKKTYEELVILHITTLKTKPFDRELVDKVWKATKKKRKKIKKTVSYSDE